MTTRERRAVAKIVKANKVIYSFMELVAFLGWYRDMRRQERSF